MLNTYIYHQLPPTCFGVCYTIFSDTIALLLKNYVLFAMLLYRLLWDGAASYLRRKETSTTLQ